MDLLEKLIFVLYLSIDFVTHEFSIPFFTFLGVYFLIRLSKEQVINVLELTLYYLLIILQFLTTSD